MQKEDLYKYLMEYSYKNSAEVIKTCTCEGGCSLQVADVPLVELHYVGLNA